MSAVDSSSVGPSRSRSRRRLAAWLAFGVAGIAAGAVWATGFATAGGQQGTQTASPILAPQDPAAHPANLAGLVTAGSTLTYNWTGRWGSVASTNMFTVDLSGQSAGNTYNVAVLLDNGGSFDNTTGWSSLQLKLEETTPAGAACAASDFDGTKNPRVMAFDTQDAGVYWNGLAGGAKYCLGIYQSDGQDTAGTFLRASSDTTPPSVYPSFIATVDQAS
jgi:hypothetical protein